MIHCNMVQELQFALSCDQAFEYQHMLLCSLPGSPSHVAYQIAGGPAMANGCRGPKLPSRQPNGSYTQAQAAGSDDSDSPPSLLSDEEDVPSMHYSAMDFNAQPSNRGTASGELYPQLIKPLAVHPCLDHAEHPAGCKPWLPEIHLACR